MQKLPLTLLRKDGTQGFYQAYDLQFIFAIRRRGPFHRRMAHKVVHGIA